MRGRGRLGLLFLPMLGKDFLEAPSFDRYAGAGGLSHLLRDFEPVHGHDNRTLPPHPLAKRAKGWATRPGRLAEQRCQPTNPKANANIPTHPNVLFNANFQRLYESCSG